MSISHWGLFECEKEPEGSFLVDRLAEAERVIYCTGRGYIKDGIDNA